MRFGNVLGSAGSVVPKFKKQIQQGGPVTVTDPEMTRYFMTITEATQLILEASAMGEDGRIYVLDMGQPVKISHLAEQLIRLSGKQPGVDVEITYTGLRAGEKLHEELFHDEENLSNTDYKKIMLADTRAIDSELIERVFTTMIEKLDNYDTSLVDCLALLVPEYKNALPNQKSA